MSHTLQHNVCCMLDFKCVCVCNQRFNVFTLAPAYLSPSVCGCVCCLFPSIPPPSSHSSQHEDERAPVTPVTRPPLCLWSHRGTRLPTLLHPAHTKEVCLFPQCLRAALRTVVRPGQKVHFTGYCSIWVQNYTQTRAAERTSVVVLYTKDVICMLFHQ